MWYQLSNAQCTNQTPITSIDIDSRVIAYGDGFFTTMAVVAGEINWLNYHLDRIENSLTALQLNLTQADLAQPYNSARDYFNIHLANFAKMINDGMLKLIVCRKRQPIKGYGFSSHEFDAFIKLMPSNEPLAARANQMILQPAASAICLTQQIACLPQPLAGLKLLNAQDKVMASHELWQYQQQQPQLIEGLVQDVMGNWVEGTFCNVFYQLSGDNTWYTPPIDHSGVTGVMRQVLLDKFNRTAIKHTERNLTTDDMAKLSRLFFCNAVRGILPIQAIILPNHQPKQLQLPQIFE